MQENMESVSSSYTTKDFNLAAFLWCYKKEGKQAQLEKFVPSQEGPNKVVLYFTFTLPLSIEDVQKLVMSYFNGGCLVEPREFAGCGGRLKDIIHNQKL